MSSFLAQLNMARAHGNIDETIDALAIVGQRMKEDVMDETLKIEDLLGTSYRPKISITCPEKVRELFLAFMVQKIP